MKLTEKLEELRMGIMNTEGQVQDLLIEYYNEIRSELIEVMTNEVLRLEQSVEINEFFSKTHELSGSALAYGRENFVKLVERDNAEIKSIKKNIATLIEEIRIEKEGITFEVEVESKKEETPDAMIKDGKLFEFTGDYIYGIKVWQEVEVPYGYELDDDFLTGYLMGMKNNRKGGQ